MPRLGLILADQLTPSLASLRVLNPLQDVLLLAEVAEETTYVAHHVQKNCPAVLGHASFCRRTAASRLDGDLSPPRCPDTDTTLLQVVQRTLQEQGCRELVLTVRRIPPAARHEYPMAGATGAGYRCRCLKTTALFVPSADFARRWAAGRKQLRMEYFYREMRRKTGLLMEGDKPIGGQWNFDADNRAAYKGEVPVPTPLSFARDAIDAEVLALVSTHFADSDHPPPRPAAPLPLGDYAGSRH